MKVFKKIGSFFAAMVPFLVYVAVQFIGGLLGMLLALAVEMISSSAIPETISQESVLIITIVLYAVCFVAAFFEMKIHRLRFKDLTPVRQKVRVYLWAVLLSLGTFFVLKFVEMIFARGTGATNTESAQETAVSMIVITYIAYLTECLLDEFVFRGLMVKIFEKRFPVWVAAVAITVSFALLHFEYGICSGILFGAVLMFIRYKFGDLILCFMVHLLVTFLSVTMSMVNPGNYETVINIGSAVGIVLVVLSMFFMIKSASKTVTPA